MINMKVIANEEEKHVLISFDTKFYPYECIYKAIQDFSGSCFSNIKGNQESPIVILKPKSDEINLHNLGYEFYNYVLGIIKNEGKVQDIIKKFE